MQDEKIPIASVQASDFGIWVAQYIEGNCRFYDLIRLRKLAKIGARVNSAYWTLTRGVEPSVETSVSPKF